MSFEPASASARSRDVRDAALELFAARGYHGTTMNDIADALGIRAPSLYNHVRSKHELLRAVMVETTDAVLREFEEAVSGIDDPGERLRRAVAAYVLRHARHRREAIVVNRDVSSLEEPVRSIVLEKRHRHERAIRALIEEGKARGTFDVASPSLASFAILEMSVSVARWFRDDGPSSAEQVAEQYGRFAIRIVGGADRPPAKRP